MNHSREGVTRSPCHGYKCKRLRNIRVVRELARHALSNASVSIECSTQHPRQYDHDKRPREANEKHRDRNAKQTYE
jgi:hypothetical protein